MSRTHAPALSTAFRAGALAALGTWAVVALPALIGWVSAPESTLPWWAGLGVGSAIWFLGHGQPVGVAGLDVSITPLLLSALFVVICWRSSRRLLALQRGVIGTVEWDDQLWRRIVPGYLLGYGSGAVAFWLVTLSAPVRPGPMAVVGALLVPVIGLALVLAAPGRTTTPAVVDRLLDRAPGWLPTAVGAAWRGAGLLLAAGGALVVLRLLGSVGTVVRIQGEYDAGLVAGLVLALAQVAFLGNAATWGVAFLAGPGFSVAVGGVISPAGAHPGLMPLIPILGALPEEARYPWGLWIVLAVPVVAGMWVARYVARGQREWSLRDRLAASGAAVAGAVLLVVVVTWLGNGAIGVERLSAVGPALLPMAGALLLEVLVGAAVWIGWVAVQGWRRSRAGAEPAADSLSSDNDSADNQSVDNLWTT